MIYLVTDQRAGEEDILTAARKNDFIITDLDGEKLAEFKAPDDGWTHEALNDLVENSATRKLTFYGADAYLGNTWVGSTEC